MLDSTYGAFEADVSYLNACPTIYPGQADYPTEAPQIWAFPVHPSDAPQLPPLEALQRADLAPEVQVTEAAAGGGNFAGGALTHPMQYFTDGAEEYPQGVDSTSYFDPNQYISEPSQVHGPAEAFLPREYPVPPSTAPKLPPPDALQLAYLAPEVQVTESAAGGGNLPGGALTHPMLYLTDGVEEYPQGADSVSYLDLNACMLESGQVHDPAEVSQSREIPALPNDAPQLPPPEAAQSAGLAPEVQLTDAADGDGSSPGEALPFCWVCNREFTRNQEVKRHLKDVHTPKRKCPFKPCAFKWIRPDKVKTHITQAHRSEFHPVVFQRMSKLCGKGLVEFVDALISSRSLERIDTDYSGVLVLEQSQQAAATE